MPSLGVTADEEEKLGTNNEVTSTIFLSITPQKFPYKNMKHGNQNTTCNRGGPLTDNLKLDSQSISLPTKFRVYFGPTN